MRQELLEQENLPTLEQIMLLQDEIIPVQCEMDPPDHFFAPGMYMRVLTIKAGKIVVGKIHKHAHFMWVVKGRAVVVSQFGRGIVEAGYLTVSQPGVKRVVLAIEDTQFVTVHSNASDTTDLEEIEAEHIEPEVLNLDKGEDKWLG